MDVSKGLSFSHKVGYLSQNPCLQMFRIFCYSTASTETAAYFIGGEDVGGQYFSTIAEFKDDEWRKIGDLAKARSSPSSITIGDETVILGGYA